MRNTNYSKVILAILLAFSFVSLSRAQAFRCLEPINGTASRICDTAKIQSAFPKLCAPAYQNVNIGEVCDVFYDSWRFSCPKKNRRVEDYCLGTGVPLQPCLALTGCTQDSDCNPIPPEPQTTFFPQCFYSCQYCFYDQECEARVERGFVAQRGNKTCTPGLFAPTCTNGGFVELTNGFCNCLSGFSNNPATPLQLCSVPPSPSCLPLAEASPLANTVVPSLRSVRAHRNLLRVVISSSLVSGRRTLIEFPNAACNLINNPGFYNKTVVGCVDQYSIEIPYADCGFLKMWSITPFADSYRGVMHIKQIDTFTVDGQTVERVVSTPFRLGIELPTSFENFARVEVITTTGNSALKTLFIGQTLDHLSRRAELTFLTSAPLPLGFRNGVVNNFPFRGSNRASLRPIDQSCSETSSPGFCQRKFAIIIDIMNCEIAGDYKMTLQFGCVHNEGCPNSFGSTVDVVVVAHVAAPSTCEEAFADVNLSGDLATFNDAMFTNQVSSFTFGKHAYFLLSTSADVEIASITLDTVYFSGTRTSGTFLLNGGNITPLALNNGFSWGQLSNSQAWFGFNVTVSSPQSPENTVFKLENDENGAYDFVVVVKVDWNEIGGSATKRMVLEGTTFSQNSHLTAQVQIVNTKQEETVSMSSTIMAPISALLASVAVSSLF